MLSPRSMFRPPAGSMSGCRGVTSTTTRTVASLART
nr:MAG TPA: hypothetical protein [Bacteriophage sp.]